VKGIVAADDARIARGAGVDGIIVSNHGGRQLDGMAAPLRVLPSIVAAAGEVPVLMDSGVRRGTDVLKALALGAKFVFVGRPFMYAAAIGGEPAVRHGIELLKQEIERDMALIGINSVGEMGPERLMKLR
jgi:L-lactate dehydrogenase (cytochrome)